MPNIKQIELPSGNTYDIKDANALHTDDLKSTTKSTLEAASMGSDSGKQYAVGLDKNGDLSVNVPWTNTTYTGANGVSLSGTTFSNSGVRSIATGSSNGTISVNTNGTSANVAVKGLGNAAYTNVTDTYSASGTAPTSGKAIKNAFDTIAPMIYKGTLGTGGTITTLPTASSENKGYVYNVITAGTYDSKAAIVGDMFISNGSAWVLVPSGDEPTGTVTSIATGVGLTGGTITTSGTIKTKLKSETASTLDSAAMGATASRQYAVGVDKSGYLSVNIPWTDTNTKVTSVGNHYAPTKDDNAELSVDASGGSSATWGTTNMVTGVNLQRDAKGHVVGVTVDSIKMPANPDTNTTYTFANGTNGFTVTPSGGSVQTVTVTPNDTTKLPLSGGTLTGTLTMAGNDIKLGTASASTDDSADIVWYYGNGQEKARIWTQNTYTAKSGLNYRVYDSEGTSLFNGTIPLENTDTKNTAGSTDTSSKIFLIGATSQAANPQTYSDNEVYVTSGALQAKTVSASSGVNANTGNSGTAGGLSLYGTEPSNYGIIARQTGSSTGQLIKHGYVQGDFAIGINCTGATNRGFIFRQAGNNVASISGEGKAVFNGSVTVGGNNTNTSGCKMEYNSTTESLDFIFA